MKTLLVGINAKYSHKNLAIEYIKMYSQDMDIDTIEYNINQNIDDIYRDILIRDVDLIGFSAYIWNIEIIRQLTADLKKARPGLIILWGGPEVSFDTQELLLANPSLDMIVRGEGEETMRDLLLCLGGNKKLETILGISYRQGEKIKINPERPLINDLDKIPSPFVEYKPGRGKLVYYEMSRGCPFKCSYCLSSTIHGVRYFSESRIKSDLIQIIESGADTVKLVDRTFNAREKFSIEIMEFIRENARPGMCFHMELMAHLISDEFLKFLEDQPKGLFQFEIGIQSSNQKTLEEISRITDLDKLSNTVKTIKSYGNIHQHVDLIAGLPHEDYESFKASFNYAYGLGAEKLQLGFLKLLRGSCLRIKSEELGLVYSDYPPYEIISTEWLSPVELRRLKMVEDLVEKFSNEDYFKRSLAYLVDESNPFGFFEEFSYFWEDHNYHLKQHSRVSLYKELHDFIRPRDDFNIVVELLRLDFLENNNIQAKNFLKPRPIDIKLYHEILRDEAVRKEFSIDPEIPTKKLVKDFKFEEFTLDGTNKVLGFNYLPSGTNIMDITKEYERIKNGLYK